MELQELYTVFGIALLGSTFWATMMLNMKRRLSFKKRRASSSSSDVEDRVVMLCEDIPSEGSLDSGRGSQSPGARSSGDSQMGYGPDWSSVGSLPERDLRQIHGGFRTDDLSMVADAQYHAGGFNALPSSIHFTEMPGCLLHLSHFNTFYGAESKGFDV